MVLYIFGAGATRGASFVTPTKSPQPPLDADFFTQLQRVAHSKHQDLISAVMSDVVSLFGHNFEVTMETVFTTLEHAIRMIEAIGGNNDTRLDELKAKRWRLMQAIAAVFEEAMTRLSGSSHTRDPRVCEHHRKFVSSVLRPRDTILSYNYDCLLDHSLKAFGSGKWNARAGYAFRKGDNPLKCVGPQYWNPPAPSSAKESVTFLKLHGSLNFRIEEGLQVSFKQRPYTKQAGGLKFSIIPPESHKDYDKGAFGPLWKHAAEQIAKARCIVIIGYSMPPTDLHSSSLFRASVGAGTLSSLVIVNPDREARKRIRTVFQSGLGTQTRVLSFNYFSEFLSVSKSIWNRQSPEQPNGN